MQIRLGELFCGAGGMGLGATQAQVGEYSVAPAWASDIDKVACKTYAANIHNNVVCCDVADLDIGALSPIDAFAYGFPCNDFSIAGGKQGANGRYGAFYEYGIEVLERHQPLFFVAENVSGLVTHTSDMLRLIIMHFRSMGYTVTPHLYACHEYGIPQHRDRVFIVGMRDDLGLAFKPPAPSGSMTAGEALYEPPIPDDTPNHARWGNNEIVAAILPHIPEGARLGRHLDTMPQWAIDRFYHGWIRLKYRRLDRSKPSPAIIARGGNDTKGLFHPTENRCLTNREAARLQTFPDDFVFEGSMSRVAQQIGMAVPPKMAEVVFTAVLKTLAGIEYEAVPANINFAYPLWD